MNGVGEVGESPPLAGDNDSCETMKRTLNSGAKGGLSLGHYRFLFVHVGLSAFNLPFHSEGTE